MANQETLEFSFVDQEACMASKKADAKPPGYYLLSFWWEWLQGSPPKLQNGG